MGFLLPVAKFVLKLIVGKVFEAEKLFPASGSGSLKQAFVANEVLPPLSQKFSSTEVPELVEVIKALIDSVVGVLNAIGLLDDEPGLKLELDELIKYGKDTVDNVIALVKLVG